MREVGEKGMNENEEEGGEQGDEVRGAAVQECRWAGVAQCSNDVGRRGAVAQGREEVPGCSPEAARFVAWQGGSSLIRGEGWLRAKPG